MHWNKRNGRFTKPSDETNKAFPSDCAVRYAGSVRGAIAVVVAAAYGYSLVCQKSVVQNVVVKAVVVVIAFCFGSHSTSTPPSVPGQPVPHHRRLVRTLLFLGFAGITAWFLLH